jgi:hypothetical protein
MNGTKLPVCLDSYQRYYEEGDEDILAYANHYY